MDDDDLLRRFAALKAPSSTPQLPPSSISTYSPAPNAQGGPSRHIESAARRAEWEDEDLARIADGRPLDLSGGDEDGHEAQGEESRWKDVRGEHTLRQAEDDALQARLKGLGGDRWATAGGDGSGEGFDDWDIGDGDEEVSIARLQVEESPGRQTTAGRAGEMQRTKVIRSMDEIKHGLTADGKVDAYIASLQQTETPDEIDRHPRSHPSPPGSQPGIHDLSRNTAAEGELARLRREADELLRLTRGMVDEQASDLTPNGAGSLESDVPPNGPNQAEDADEETEQEILERALAEAELERVEDVADDKEALDTQPSRASTPAPGQADVPAQQEVSGEDDQLAKLSARLSFPSIPKAAPVDLPADKGTIDDADANLEARMQLLAGLSGPSAAPIATSKAGRGLPSVPSAKPGKDGSGRQVGQGWNLPGWHDGRDDDLDSWCCTCPSFDGSLLCSERR